MTQGDSTSPQKDGETPSRMGFLPFFIVGSVLLVAGLVVVPAIQADMRAASIRGYGAERLGRVIEIQDTGNEFNDDPVVVVTVEIEEEGRKVRGSVKDAISPVHLPRFQPGATIKVWINPDAPEEMALEDGL